MLNIYRSTAFRCSADERTVLALPKGATVCEVRNRRESQTFAARHAIRWYKYMLDVGMDVSNGSLYFVTEYEAHGLGHCSFLCKADNRPLPCFICDGESYQWARRGKVEAIVGLKSMDNFDCDTGEPNQCVFLRSYKIMLRQDGCEIPGWTFLFFHKGN